LDNWSPCPRCGSGNVRRAGMQAVLLTLFCGLGFLLWIGLLLPVIWPVLPLMFIFSLIIFFAKETLQCAECKYTWLFRKK